MGEKFEAKLLAPGSEVDFSGVKVIIRDGGEEYEIGKVESFTLTEEREVRAIMSIDHPGVVEKLVPVGPTTFSMSCSGAATLSVEPEDGPG